MTGMIFQFNSDEGRGLIMLTDGQTKEFNASQWADENNMPSVGLKISYDESSNDVKIKMYDELEGKKNLSFSTADEYIQYFKESGFNLVKDTKDDESRTVTLRKFSIDEHSEVIIESRNDKTTVTRTVNGKKVVD